MPHFNNGYELVISTWEEAGRWRVWVEIKPKATGLNGIEVAGDTSGRRFDTKDDAEAAALRVAKEWINQNLSDEETREELEKRMDELASRYAETRDEKIKRNIEQISCGLAEIRNPP